MICPVGRKPLANPADEVVRVQRYWAWLNENRVALSKPRPGARAGIQWVKLRTPADADFEACWMDHSVGHGWMHYGAAGNIYSLRRDGIPQATILVSCGRAVHAREQRNARLCPENEAHLKAFSRVIGFEIVPESCRFNAFAGEGDNTKLTLMRRTQEGGKRWGEVVVTGRYEPSDVDALNAQIEAYGGLDAVLAAPAELERQAGDSHLELVTLSHTAEDASDGNWTQIRAAVDGVRANGMSL